MNNAGFLGIFTGALALLIGCETIDRARRAQGEADRVPGEMTISSQDAGLTNGVAYSLGELEAIALSHNPNVCQAQQTLDSARMQLDIVRAGRQLQVTANGGYSRSTQNSAGRHPYRGRTSGSWSGGLDFNLLLYDFGKLDAQEKQTIENIIAAEQQLRQIQIETVYALRTAFFERLRRIQLLQVAIENQHQYEVHLNEAKTMLRVGTRRKYDVTKANVDWGNACLDVITASNNLRNAEATLNAALGFADSPEFALKEEGLPDRQLDVGVDSLMAIARENAPALAVAHARERAASAEVDRMIAELYPDLTAGFSLDLSGRSFPAVWNFSWFARGVATLFNGKRNLTQIEQAVSDLRSARATVAETEQTLYENLVKAVTQRDGARESSRVAQMVYEQAKENLSIVEEQYKIGTSSSIERTDAQVSVTQAHANVVTAFYDEQDAQAKIACLIGTLFSNQN